MEYLGVLIHECALRAPSLISAPPNFAELTWRGAVRKTARIRYLTKSGTDHRITNGTPLQSEVHRDKNKPRTQIVSTIFHSQMVLNCVLKLLSFSTLLQPFFLDLRCWHFDGCSEKIYPYMIVNR